MEQPHSLLTTRLLLDDARVSWQTACLPSIGMTICGRGYAFTDDGAYLEGQAFVEHVLARCGAPIGKARANLKELIPRLNGAWALAVTFADGGALAATDRSRSIPLFYALKGGHAVISSSPSAAEKELGRLTIAKVAAAEILLSGYVSGRHTLYENIFKVQPSEIVEFLAEGGHPVIHRSGYFPYYPSDSCSTSEGDLKDELEQILESNFERFAKALQGRRIVLPLSGGYDSRLIGWMLHKNGIRNVLCYTYGEAGNHQVEIARQVAHALGFEWRFIEYSAERWARCSAEAGMKDYWNYTFQGTALPHYQDYPALSEIMASLGRGDPPVILPGHVGDAWAGEFALKALNSSALHPLNEAHSRYMEIEGDPVTSAIIHRHLNLWPVAGRQWQKAPWRSVARKIKTEAASYGHALDRRVWGTMEWVLRNRTALWILRSGRCCEFLGGEWRLCLGDYKIMDFFRKLPLPMLYSRRLYAETIQERIWGRAPGAIRDIPVISGGRRGNPAKRAVLEFMKAIGLYGAYEGWRRSRHPRRVTAADTWFTQGKASQDISVGEALMPYRVKEFLPAEVLEVVLPHFGKPAHAIQGNGLLAAVILAASYETCGRSCQSESLQA